MNKRKWTWIAAVVVIVGIAVLGIVWYKKVHQSSEPVAESQTQGCVLTPYTGTVPFNQASMDGGEDLRGGMICRFAISARLPMFAFYFAGQPDNTLGNIDITEGDSSTALQTIQNTTSYDATLAKAEDTLKVVDANFDGYQDLQILNNCGATGNCSYDFYLYDPSANKFVHNDFLSNLETPLFDETKQQVTAKWNMSAGDGESDTYQYENSKFMLTHKIVSTWDRNANTVTVETYDLQNGQMKLVDASTTPF